MKNKIFKIFFLLNLILCQSTYANADITEAKPLFEVHQSGLYDLIIDLQKERKKIYDDCIKSSINCSNIFTTDITYNLTESTITYFSEASFPAKLNFPLDCGMNNRDFYMNISYGCRVFVKENMFSKFVALSLPNIVYYKSLREHEIINIRHNSKIEEFSFKQIINNGSFFLNLEETQIDHF